VIDQFVRTPSEHALGCGRDESGRAVQTDQNNGFIAEFDERFKVDVGRAEQIRSRRRIPIATQHHLLCLARIPWQRIPELKLNGIHALKSSGKLPFLDADGGGLTRV
jgi:hypothetical protein